MNTVFRPACAAALCALAVAGSAQAAAVVFNSDPFAGSTANPNDNIRTVFAGRQISLPSFDVNADQFVFDPAFFNVGGVLNFASGLAASLPSQGVNMIVIQDTAAGFNAGTAANLIADAITQDGAGFFVYSNRVLGVNRLVYSTNLNVNTADLSILARIESPSGANALPALAGFSARNFALQVPEPASWALALAGLCMVGAMSPRRRASGPR